MSYYFVAHIKIEKDEEYQKYIDKVEGIFKKYKGKYLAVDNNPEILEGDWNYTRTVLISFNNKNDFNDWYSSVEYQEILKHRLKGAICDTVLVKGLE